MRVSFYTGLAMAALLATQTTMAISLPELDIHAQIGKTSTSTPSTSETAAAKSTPKATPAATTAKPTPKATPAATDAAP